MAGERLELGLRAGGERTLLLAPRPGIFTCALEAGQVVVPGTRAGALAVLDRFHELVVPPGAAGRIVSERPERVHAPVGWGEVLYELEPLESVGRESPESAAARPDASGALALPSPSAGRFWHCPSPSDPPFVRPGDELTDGRPVGLIEVMKTFAHVPYRAGRGLPERARVLRVAAADGAEVAEGDALVEVEPA